MRPLYATLTSMIALMTAAAEADPTRQWLAGDHHVHSRFSGKVKDGQYVLGADGIYTIPKNAEMAQKYGLTWFVSTDHGGLGLSQLHYDQTWPEVVAARKATPELIIFYGMELDTPGGDHSSIILPIGADERERLRRLEHAYAKHEVDDPARDTTENMLKALADMDGLTPKPLVFAHHPSRSAKGASDYNGHTPWELRAWHDTAPSVAVGMEGAPGHQGTSLKVTDSPRKRGYYVNSPTYGGFDIMTAKVGGVWDSFLGEGRRFWITATSDSHRNVEDGGEDFWPGQYAKTYVLAAFDQADIMDGLRHGRIFVATGDLISELDMDIAGAHIGGTAQVKAGQMITLKVRLRDPSGPNANGDRPELKRVDVIMGDITGKADPKADSNPTTRVVKRFTAADWTRTGEVITLSYRFKADRDAYIRLRGTSTEELEPQADPLGENPWPDLWVYSNPVFVEVK